MYTPEMTIKIEQFRQKARDNTLTREDMKEAVELLRKGRGQAAATSAASKTKSAAKKTPIDSDDLLSQLG